MIEEASHHRNIWERLRDRRRIPRRWWWPDPSLYPETTDKHTDWQAKHDEVSKTMRRTMLAIFTYSTFCLFTLSGPDYELLKNKITVPIVKIEMDFGNFLIIGPLILVVLVFYLQNFIDFWRIIPADRIHQSLPYIFNLPGKLSKFLSGFLFYWVPIITLFFLILKLYRMLIRHCFVYYQPWFRRF
jgi:hypothetical protein